MKSLHLSWRSVAGLLVSALIIGSIVYILYERFSLEVSIFGVSISKVELKPDWEAIFKSIVGEPLLPRARSLLPVFSAVSSISLNVSLQIRNLGFLRSAISSISYTLFVNKILLGTRTYTKVLTLSPRCVRMLHIIWTVNMSYILVEALVRSGGKMNIEVNGHIRLSSVPLSIPFQAFSSLSIVNDVESEIINEWIR